MADLFDWWWLFALILFCLIGCLSIFILILTNLYGFDICLTNVTQFAQPTRSVQWLSTLSLFSFTITCASQMYVVLCLDSEAQVAPNIVMQCIQFLGLLAWTFGQLFIYLLFIANLHHSFKNTVLRLSNSSLIFLTTSIVLFCLCRIAYITLYTLYYNKIISGNEVNYPLAYTVCGTEFVDLIVSIILVYLFIHRLFKLVRIIPTENYRNMHRESLLIQHSSQLDTESMHLSVKTKEIHAQNDGKHVNDDGEIFEHDDEDIVEEYDGIEYEQTCEDDTETVDQTYTETGDTLFDERQETILYVASKYVILSSIAIVSTQFFLISAAFDAMSFRDNGNTEFYLISFGIYYSLLALDSFINALCICLNFEFNKVWFWTICCLCDDCCYNICLCLSKRDYRSSRKSMQSYKR